MERLALLAVTAHPGDELAIAGTLASNAQAGMHVALACATGNEGDSDLHCACDRLGVAELHVLGYRNSGQHGENANAPGALARASACEVVRRIVHLIRTIRPQVMLTFGPDGITRHVDHVAIGDLATQAFEAGRDWQQFPPAGGPEPYAPSKLFYFGLPLGLLQLVGLPGPATPESEIAARVDVMPFVTLKVEAARCYRGRLERLLNTLLQLPPAERQHLLGVEYLTLVEPQPAVDDRRDPHLFAGLP